jgi:hypothetical protein
MRDAAEKEQAQNDRDQEDVIDLFGKALSCHLEDCSRGVIGEASATP